MFKNLTNAAARTLPYYTVEDDYTVYRSFDNENEAQDYADNMNKTRNTADYAYVVSR